ncbi:MAG: beta-lactamase family protein [Saprospiraceae bacterium]|nr:beta-lactamase family protein [Saprospiraceae bacterium]
MQGALFSRPGKNIQGFTSQDFSPVKEAFIDNFKQRGELGAACSIYHRGKKVVDLWGGYRNPKTREPWEENTIVQVFSTTKGMTLLVLAKLHSEGLLDYNEKVATYWPEFARNGKDQITVEQLVTHKAGLVLLGRQIMSSELNNHRDLSRILENVTPMWQPGKKHGYHSASIGLYIQQLVLRIDRMGRTVGQYFTEEITQPLKVDFHIGLPRDFDRQRFATIKKIKLFNAIFNLGKPPRGLVWQMIRRNSLMNQSFSTIVSDVQDPLQELQYENPSGGGAGSARALAKVYGILAKGGDDLDISPETLAFISKFTAPPEDGIFDEVMKWESLGSSGGFAKPDAQFRFSNDSAFGFVGSGGSFAFADPQNQIGYAYVTNKMDFYGMNDPREVALREAMYQCVAKLKKKEIQNPRRVLKYSS